MEKEQPIGAYSEFHVGKTQIHQILEFHYWDPSKIYVGLQKIESLKGELEFIKQNLQGFIDEDKLYVNQIEVPMFVKTVVLSYKKEDPHFPILTFQINSDSYQLNDDEENCLLLVAEQEIATYKIQAIWNFPGPVQRVITQTPFQINQQQAILTAIKGQKVGGKEYFYFSV